MAERRPRTELRTETTGNVRPIRPWPLKTAWRSIPSLLEILVCPLTKGPLAHTTPPQQELISQKAGLAYPIRDGIPIMLAEEARELNPDEAPSTASA